MQTKLYILFLCFAFLGANSFMRKDEKSLVPIASGPKTTFPKKPGEEMINVRVLSQSKAVSVLIAPQKGVYQLIADGKLLMDLNEQSILKATLINDSIELKTFETIIGNCKSFKIVSDSGENTIKLKMLQPDRKPRFFD